MPKSTAAEQLGRLLRPLVRRINPALAAALVEKDVPAALAEAMRYAVLGGGKRVRPALVLLSAEAVADPPAFRADPMPAAVAVELVHCYSLIHDDLPALDNDALRRGQPTVHVKFGQAMAILAGDALLTRAFAVLACGPVAGELAAELAAGAGGAGMIAGQVADLGLCPVPPGLEGVRYIHWSKTAVLFRSAVRMGAICAAAAPPQLDALTTFAERMGLAFQMTDDLLDAVGPAEALGKTPGKDAEAGKRSYVAEVGIQQTRRLARELSQEAGEALEIFGRRADRLRKLATVLARRDR